ncbi:MAG: type IV toxin-antitoxin system AbiEi family antitoxin [Prevotellaceae bacterium]|jgi:predicted transcriptional regulator of viral defense system|nr:type IV toxin-antitoxin system AbiEi family antitoxin [Prevotellaceae bacterium]
MNKINKATYNYLGKYLTEVRSKGRYTFTLDELKNEFNLSYSAIKQKLYRLKQKKEIVQIRQGFYVIIPPEYSKQGILPPYLFIADLMKWLNKPYYVGLLSAAAMYGAAHQQPMGYTIVAKTPAPRNIDKLKIVFFSKHIFLSDGIIQKKTAAGYINVSSPELTALDFFDNIHKFGLNRITTILQELTEGMKPSALAKIAKQYPNTAAIQRLGYILENEIGTTKISDILHKILMDRQFFVIPLSPQKEKKGEIDSKWKIIKNIEIESDI